MKLASISDLHLVATQPQCRTDDIITSQWEKLEHMLHTAKTEECKAVLFAGDITDSARSWYVLPALTRILAKDWGMKFYAVYGQHDTYMYADSSRDRTNLGVLQHSDIVRILGKKPRVLQGVRLYGTSWGGVIPKPPNRKKPNVLVIHGPIGPGVYPGHETTPALRFLKKHSMFDLIVCGDVHRRFCESYKGRFICNSGPMVRKWSDDYMLRHRPCFYIWDSAAKSIEEHDIPVEPAEEVITVRTNTERSDNSEVISSFVDMLLEDNRTINIDQIVKDVAQSLNADDDIVATAQYYVGQAKEQLDA